MAIYGPDDVWPEHGEARWNEVLELARAKGWTLETYTSHRFGSIKCPTDECYFPPIDKSASGTESFAKNKKRIVERCRHGDRDQRTIAQRVEHHLEVGERLASAASALLKRDAQLEKIEELWAAADASLTEADDAVIEADLELADWWSREHASRADKVLAETDPPVEAEALPVVRAADAQVAHANEGLKQVSPGYGGLGQLRERRDRLAEHIRQLGAQAGLQADDRH